MTYRLLLGATALALTLAAQAPAQQPAPPSPAWWPQAYGYYVPQPVPPAYSWVMSASGDKVMIQSMDSGRAVCESLSIPVSGGESVKVTAEGSRVNLRSGARCRGCKNGQEGDSLQGSADRVSRSGQDGAVLTLEGNAKLSFVRKGKCAELTADRIAVDLTSGRVESELERPSPVSPVVVPVSPLTTVTPVPPPAAVPPPAVVPPAAPGELPPPAPPATSSVPPAGSTADQKQIFSFYLGYFD